MLSLRHSGPRTRRAKRVAAAALALLLMASHTFAAMGVCIAKTPIRTAPPLLVAVETHCPQHVADVTEPAGDLAATHCPQDDPGAQPRTTDLPAGNWVAAPAFTRVDMAPRVMVATRAVVFDRGPPEPLYVRLSRLQL